MQNLRSVSELTDLQGKTVIVRADLDVAVEKGEVLENFRIRKAIPTIEHLVKQKARVVVIGHMGRPEGQYDDQCSLMPVRFELGNMLNMHIKFAHIPNSRNSIIYMEDGEVLLLENTRFHPEEQSEDSEVKKQHYEQLGKLCHYYVNDAFASLAAKDASIHELAGLFEDRAYAGMQLIQELDKLSVLNQEVNSPYVAVIGGAKVDTKIEILETLSQRADSILIGGAMAYTFLKAQGVDVGDSKVELDKIEIAKKIIAQAKSNQCELVLPVDHIGGLSFDANTERIEIDTQNIPAGMIGLDVGEKTLAMYLEIIKSAKTILWNGPMGVFEWSNFSRGTEAIGEYIGLSASRDAYKVAGGGDTITAMTKLKVNMKNFNHVSTGGGAMLSYLAGKEFDALKYLS